MATTNFIDGRTPVVATWLNDVDDIVYRKITETVSVQDRQFGAIGDGVTDDTAAIQAAIDYLYSAGGGQLDIPKGTYGITDTIFIKNNIRLVGKGRPEIKAISVFSGAMLQFGYTTGVVTDAPTHPCSNAEINGLVINGDYKVTSEYYAPGLTSGLVYVWKNSPYNKVINCEIKSAESSLMDAEDGADFFELRDCIVHDITSTSIDTQFQNLLNIDGPTNALISGNKVYGLNISGYSPSSWGYALRLHATDNSVVIGNSFDSGYHNILLDGRSNLISGNRCTNGETSNIVLYQNEFYCRYNTIIGNYCESSVNGIFENDAGYTGRVSDNFIAFNTIKNVTNNIVTEGQNTTVFQNNVFDTGGTILSKLDYFGSTYTPTLSNITNISASIAYVCQYTKIGNIVTVSGKVDITPTATGAFDIRMTLPISTTFTATEQAGGTTHDTLDQSGVLFADTSTPGKIRMQGSFNTTSARSWWFTYTYRLVV